MKTDTYTKTLLTIIAVCLTIIGVRDLEIIPKVHANTSNTISGYTTVPVNKDGSITVRISNTDKIDVNIKEISTYDKLRVDLQSISTSDELDVNIDEIGGGWVSHGGPVKVKIQN